MTKYVLRKGKREAWLAEKDGEGFTFTPDRNKALTFSNKATRQEFFKKLPPDIRGKVGFGTLDFKVRKPNTACYFRKETYSVEEVLPFIGDCEKNYDGDFIHMDSERYLNFATHGLTCVDCGLVGSFFAKETTDMFSEIPRYHFNLYAIDKDGAEVLMTKDHIIPRSKGGADSNENYQPMCTRCNRRKGNKMPGVVL